MVKAADGLQPDETLPASTGQQQAKFLRIHGTVQYEYLQRSRIDTPYQQADFWQHTERVSLSILVRDKFPFRVGFTSRQSNSPFFRNFDDLGLQFDRTQYLNLIRQKLLADLEIKYARLLELRNMKSDLSFKRMQLRQLEDQKSSPVNLQKIIEQKEREFSGVERHYSVHSAKQEPLLDLGSVQVNTPKFKFGSKAKKDTPNIGFSSPKTPISEKTVDSLSREIEVLERRYDSTRANIQRRYSQVVKMINLAKDEAELVHVANQSGMSLSKPSGLQRQLSYVTHVGIGRTSVDYTELTAQNINVTGVNLEYQNKVYAAFAAGKIDYRYRDFFNRSAANTGQYLVLGRIGIRNNDKRAFILTIYQGRKNRSEFALADSVGNRVSIMGYSLQAIFRRDATTGMSFEFAKSTRPVLGNIGNEKSNRALLEFKDGSNNGFFVKGETRITATNTRFSGFYRSTGQNFQSFSLFGYNSHQTAWQTRAEQDLFKRRLLVVAAFRQNDFSNPFAEKTYKATTIFKSIQLHARFPKYPLVSLGYYPGTQIYLIDKDRIQESAFYILNATLSYGYLVSRMRMNTTFVYNRYITKATDPGFVAYRGTQIYGAQTIFFHRFQMQLGFARTDQPELVYSSYDAGLDMTILKRLKISGSEKFTRTKEGKEYWGEMVRVGTESKRWGGIQVQYEKAFLPTLRNAMGPVEIGSISWFKTF